MKRRWRRSDGSARRAALATAALLGFAHLARPAAAQSESPIAASRPLRLVRATDGSPIAGAEVFDFDAFRLPGADGLHRSLVETGEPTLSEGATRLVADDRGFVRLIDARVHALLARAPGWIASCDLLDAESASKIDGYATLRLYPDEPLTIELVDRRGAPIQDAPVELVPILGCGEDRISNRTWRVDSDADGRVLLPHYFLWMTDSVTPLSSFVTPALPLADAPLFRLDPRDFVPVDHAPVVHWVLPPLSRLRIEFLGADHPGVDVVRTADVISRPLAFGTPDRWRSEGGKPIEVWTEAGVPLRAVAHWSFDAGGRHVERRRYALLTSSALEGSVARMRLFVDEEPVAVRVRPVLPDRTTFSERPFTVLVEWKDRLGVRFFDPLGTAEPGDDGVLHLSWLRPRLPAGEPPPRLRVVLADANVWRRFEFVDDLAGRDLDWTTGPELDAGTLPIPASR